ncbi:unnamed protein product [Closterium sp. NIES-64]|nr:unnamed protein product [Closterium sp. NIES-64]
MTVTESTAATAGLRAAADEAVTRAWVGGLRVLVVDDTPVNLRRGPPLPRPLGGACDHRQPWATSSGLNRCWLAGVLPFPLGGACYHRPFRPTSSRVDRCRGLAAGMAGSRAYGTSDSRDGAMVASERGGEERGVDGRGVDGRGEDERGGGASWLQHGFDLVLMDLQMPGMDGQNFPFRLPYRFAVAEAIRALERKTVLGRATEAQLMTDVGTAAHAAAAAAAGPATVAVASGGGVKARRSPTGASAGDGAAASAAATAAAGGAAAGGWAMSLRVPIVALTADVDRGVVQRCAEGGFDGVLQKPVDAHLLAAHLSQISFQRSLRR